MIVWKFFFGFMSLLIASIVENSRTLPGIYFIFLENILDQTWKSFNTIFGPQWKDPKSSFQVRQDLPLFCKLLTLSLG